ncbi:hypothetical protein [Sphingomonas oryzagri]|uniref:Yip1 domain-containing protein n=1 Tax=Sphingomonas oryzagri TaxID=3042314 RepID=A0ABT6N5V7_9SPHN|nr:hypothetical protein [Sphingomonas oryzagri]MDH7640497.1 hypothetical protein [Sphingomonas oryzagri]
MDRNIGNADTYATPRIEARVEAIAHHFGEQAAPDVPAAVGLMLVASFATIMGSFLLLYTGSRFATMMVAISIVYTAIYLSVPTIFLRIDARRGGHVGMAEFLEKGLDTWTGHVGGREAIVQFLTIPVAIAIAVFGIGVAAALIL